MSDGQVSTPTVAPAAPVAAAATMAAAAATGTPYKEMSKKVGIIILIVVAMFAIILIVVYIVNMVKKSSLKQVQVLNKVVALDNRQVVPYKVPAGVMDVTLRGQEFSYSFWVYLSPQYDATANHKLILARGNPEGELTNFSATANPIVFMHKSTNVMYFALSTTEVKDNNNTLSSIINKNANGQFTSKYLMSHIDYVPLQRWVNIVMSVRDSSMTIFMDSDIYSVVNVADIPWDASQARPIIRGTQGEAVIGDNSNPTKGFMSHMQFFNYAVTQDQVKDIYKAGPVKQTFLGKLGLGNYAFRTPVYKVEEQAKQ